jgi:beta-glucanase (GH16 family)
MGTRVHAPARIRALLAAATAALVSVVAPASSAQAAGSDLPLCGGEVILKSNGEPWECTWSDEFDGSSLDRSNWFPQETPASNWRAGDEGCWVDDPDNIFVSKGTLKLVARKEEQPFECGNFTTPYSAAAISTYGGRFSQTYGRFEARMKVPNTNIQGLQEAFWLWPVDPFKYGLWPRSGEIDVAEMYSNYNDRAIPYIHYAGDEIDWNVTNNYCLIDDLGAWHTYAVEWTTETIKIIYDGKTCLVDDWKPGSPLVKPQPFDHPFTIVLDQSFGVNATNNAVVPETPLPATTEVDYVRVWK